MEKFSVYCDRWKYQNTENKNFFNVTTPLEQKFSYGDIQKYTDIYFQSASRMQFLRVNK